MIAIRKIRLFLIFLVSLFFFQEGYAVNLVCGEDLDGDGSASDPGETASCKTIDNQLFCPVATDCNQENSESCQATPFTFQVDVLMYSSWTLDVTFDLKTGEHQLHSHAPGSAIELKFPKLNYGEICKNGNSVRHTGTVRKGRKTIRPNLAQTPSCSNGLVGRIIHTVTSGTPVGTRVFHGTISFSATRDICTNETTYTCPFGEQYACLNNGGKYQCSQNTCVDLDTSPPIITDEIDGTMLVDDGAKDSQGFCMDQLLIFSGRALECQQSGVSTAFQDCCDNGSDKVFSDDMGSVYDSASTITAVKSAYDLASVGYASYKVYMNAGYTAAQASAGAANSMMFSVDPTSLALSIAVNLVVSYLTKACDQESSETAIMDDSGFCHYVGDYCKKKWPLIGCVQEAEGYCCFNSKMARIIHQQGRPQLNTFGASSWGDPESPNCRGFKPEEFQSLDFSKIDLTEYYNDLTHQTSTVIRQKMKEGVNKFYDKTR